MSLENMCHFFKFGYCKFKSKCKNKHVVERYKSQNCRISNCSERHPKGCFYWLKFGNCKLGKICAYDHESNHDKEKEDDIVSKVLKKLDDLEENSKEKVKILEDKIQNVENEN